MVADKNRDLTRGESRGYSTSEGDRSCSRFEVKLA
jgi:hypothetical protein